MKEKLIDLLCQAHNKATDASAFDDATYAQQLEVEAEHLIAHGVTFAEDNNVPSKWISVNDRLPDMKHFPMFDPICSCNYEATEGYVLAYSESEGVRMLECSRDDVGIWWSEEGGTAYKDVTHWMPLPMPPKGE